MRTILSIVFLAGLAFASDPMENPGLFEGDMELRPDQKMNIQLSIAGIPTYGATTGRNWPTVIPYQIDSSISRSSAATGAIRAAINDFHSKTCLRFRRRTSSDRAYINFQSGGGCSSPVGYYGSVNNIKLAPGCWIKGIVIHEIMHSLGFYHEQSRPDRDRYVRILWHNVPGGTRNNNFQKYSYRTINSLGSRYDYGSVMHYSSTAFGGGRTTIQPLQRGVTIGQRNGFSPQDIYQIKRKYRCRW